MFRKKKSLGQNFLYDHNIAKKIVSFLNFDIYNYILEVGPGQGILTEYLINICKNLYLIEIDERLVLYLKKKFPSLQHRILHINFLYWFPHIKDSEFGLIGNFPYYISSKIIFKIINMRNYIPEVIGMFQKEFVEKLIIKNNKIVNKLSVLVNVFYYVEILFSVDKSVFSPSPKVESYVLRLKRKKNINFNYIMFFKIIQQAFNYKRKILRNSLKSFIFSQKIKDYHLLDKRPQELSINEYIFLTQNTLYNNKIL